MVTALQSYCVVKRGEVVPEGEGLTWRTWRARTPHFMISKSEPRAHNKGVAVTMKRSKHQIQDYLTAEPMAVSTGLLYTYYVKSSVLSF